MQVSVCQNCKTAIYFGLFRTFGSYEPDYDPSEDGTKWRHTRNGYVTCVGGSLSEMAVPGQITEMSEDDIREHHAKKGGSPVRFVKFRDEDGQYRFRIVAVNNEIVAQSEGYENEKDRDDAIALIKLGADQASVVEKDPD